MRRASRLPVLCALAAAAALAAVSGSTGASFSSQADSMGNAVSAAPDYRAPTVGASAIAKDVGGSSGFVHQAGGYRVYANVNDTGQPASGVASVTANVANVTPGQTTVPLSAGSFSVGGGSYGYRSSVLTATSPLAEGVKPFSVTTTDVAGNGPAQGAFGVTIDNTAPAGADIQTHNGAATVRKAEAGDSITFTYTEPMDPWSILPDWDGSPTAVVVQLVNGLLVVPDQLLVYDAHNVTQLPLGVVKLGLPGYVGGLLGGEIGTFGATGTPSTMVQNGSAITVTLGTPGGQAATTALLSSTMTWTPSSTATDRAGNASAIADVTESGSADGEF